MISQPITETKIEEKQTYTTDEQMLNYLKDSQPKMECLGTYKISFYASGLENPKGTKENELIPYYSCATVRIGGFPYGTILFIEGWGFVKVEDTFANVDKYGRRIRGNRLDLFVNTAKEANELGRQEWKVWIVK